MLADLRIAFPQDITTNVLILLRWVHIIAGILWVGMLYFFVLVNSRFLPTLDAPTRSRIYPLLMPRALWWFRWASVVTVLMGLAYWMRVASLDARNYALVHNVNASPGRVFWTFFLFWTLAFFIEMAVLMAPAPVLHRIEIVAPVTFAAVIIAAWLYVTTNNQGWESNRVLCIGIGGGIGWFMMFNVWGLVWRVQKKLIRWHTDNPNGGPLPDKLAHLANAATLAARVNFVLSFPLLFFMAAASHYPFLG
jgi:uncharacterized membrane protein